MASNKFTELQGFSDDDLQKEVAKIQEQYTKMNFEHATRGLEKPLELREVRRDIARIKTEIRRRELAAMSAEQLAGRSKMRERRRRN